MTPFLKHLPCRGHLNHPGWCHPSCHCQYNVITAGTPASSKQGKTPHHAPGARSHLSQAPSSPRAPATPGLSRLLANCAVHPVSGRYRSHPRSSLWQDLTARGLCCLAPQWARNTKCSQLRSIAPPLAICQPPSLHPPPLHRALQTPLHPPPLQMPPLHPPSLIPLCHLTLLQKTGTYHRG